MNLYINFDPKEDDKQDVIAMVSRMYGSIASTVVIENTATTTKAAPAQGPGDEIDISPQVKTFAEKHDVDISQLTGTGKRGKIIRADVVNFINAHKAEEDARGGQPEPDLEDDLDPLGDNLDPLGDDPVTRDDVRNALKEYASLESKTAAIKILKDNGSSSIGELEESKFQAVIDACKK